MVIVAAVDRARDERETVEEGRSLAAAFDEELHVVHCVEESDFRELERTSYERTGESIDVSELEDAATEIAAEAAGDTADCQPVGLVGNPTQRLLEYGRENDARYLVVGGRKQSPVGKALFGSVTQSILLNADRPIVTVMEGE